MLNDPKNKIRTSTASHKHPTWRENLSYYFSQYSSGTSIHGVQYIGDRDRLLIERLIWTVYVLFIASVCIFFISQTYHKWVTSPVIVTFATTETPISEIPFPAVTITPLINNLKFNFVDVARKRSENRSSLTDEENLFYETFSLVCPDFSYQISPQESEENLFTDELQTISIYENPYIIDENLTRLTWLGQSEEMLETVAVRPVFSKEGISLTFNMLDETEIFTKYEPKSSTKRKRGPKVRKWSLDDGYGKGETGEVYPKRTFVAGTKGGLQIMAFANHDDVKHSCSNMFTGYAVTLHHPCELPDSNNHFILPLNQAVFVAIKPKMITISEKLKRYKPEDRKCFLNDERKLKYFDYYTQENCLRDCVLNETLERCDCKPFYMLEYDDDSKICGWGSISCMAKTEESLPNIKEKCNCLPSCTSLEYEIETTQTPFDLLSIGSLSEDTRLHSSLLTVFYKEMQFLSAERNELYGYVDFFSSTGGLLGLFIGISVTSMIEILYFLTLRLACNIKKFGKRFWSGAPELMEAEK